VTSRDAHREHRLLESNRAANSGSEFRKIESRERDVLTPVLHRGSTVSRSDRSGVGGGGGEDDPEAGEAARVSAAAARKLLEGCRREGERIRVVLRGPGSCLCGFGSSRFPHLVPPFRTSYRTLAIPFIYNSDLFFDEETVKENMSDKSSIFKFYNLI
jgi:hypothetical protein